MRTQELATNGECFAREVRMRAAGLLMLALAAALAASPAAAQGELGDILPGPIRSTVGDLAALREIDAVDQMAAEVKTACKTLKGYDRPALHAFYQGLMTAQEEAAKRALLAQEEQALYYERRRAEYVRYYVNAMTPCVLQRIDELNAPEPAVAAKLPAAGAAKPPVAAAKPPATPPSPVAVKPPANPPVEIASTAPASSAPAAPAETSPPASLPVAPAESAAPPPPLPAKPPAPAKSAAAKPPASPPPTPSETVTSPPPAAAPSAPAPAAAKALPEKPSVAAANPLAAPTETSAAPAPAEVATAPPSLPAAAPAAPEANAAQPNAEPAAEPLPDNITVTDYNVKNGTATIVLSKVKDNIYEGTWDTGGFKSRVTVTAFAPNRLVMRRQDFGGDGVGKGMTYAGKRAGNRVDATGYKFPDPLGLGTWEAKW
jgi:hypothetical protein